MMCMQSVPLNVLWLHSLVKEYRVCVCDVQSICCVTLGNVGTAAAVAAVDIAVLVLVHANVNVQSFWRGFSPHITERVNG